MFGLEDARYILGSKYEIEDDELQELLERIEGAVQLALDLISAPGTDGQGS